MSRIGRLPITIPAGVSVNIADNGEVTVKGKLGELKGSFRKEIKIEEENGELKLTRCSDEKEIRALHGLTRALLHNMVVGVSEGFSKTLEIVGVGYRVQLSGKNLTFNMGFSHPVEVAPPAGITFESPNNTTIVVKGIDKQLVGQVAANIRGIRPPEPYKGKGIRYQGEHVRRKVGKTGM